MTDEQRKKLFELLRGALSELAREAQDRDPDYYMTSARRAPTDARLLPQGFQVDHLWWMLDQLEAEQVEGDEKIARWVGFLQGAAWTLGARSIDELRQMVIDSEGT